MIKELRFDSADLTDQPITRGHRILKKMQAAGWPVVGVLWPERVETGTLTVETEGDEFFGGLTIIYRWES